TYTPDPNYAGPDSFRFAANDGIATSNTATVTITVTPVNDPPTANAGPDRAADEGDTVSFSGSGSDIDGNVTYSWVLRRQGSTSAITSGSSATFRVVVPDDGVFVATLQVCDNGTPLPSRCASDTATVVVANVAPDGRIGTSPSNGPRIDTMDPFTDANKSHVTFGVIASDVPADPLSYEWDFGDGVTTSPQLGLDQVTHAYGLGQFDPIVTIRDGDGGVRIVRFRRVTVQALGGCNGITSSTIGQRLLAWWGAGTRVTVDSRSRYWVLNGTDQHASNPARYLQPGQTTTTRGAGGGELQSGCVGGNGRQNDRSGTRYIGVNPQDYLAERDLIKNPLP
ncbi:MAG TPA: PKD domain-containing protein, partial [Candidatus Limnocylindrales bacterium]